MQTLALFPPIRKTRVTTVQFNIGRLCNQACRHCHVDSSPARIEPEHNASPQVLEAVLALLQDHPELRTLDITGGAPELNPGFRGLVRRARALERTVLVRHNLTVQNEPGQEDLPRFFAEQGVALFCSLPCYLETNVDQQRGNGVFEKSIEALRRLNRVGYGEENGSLELNLVYNPLGASLPPDQASLEADYRRELAERFGVCFHRLVTITNQPIHRFRDDLERKGELEGYFQLLRDNYNEATLAALMCRDAVSVRWDGRLYDCDFNLVVDLPLRGRDGRPLLLQSLMAGGAATLHDLAIATDQHCFACTAGCGSSCGGALV